MSDLLELLAAHENTIVIYWSKAIRDQPNSPYARLDDETLEAAIRQSARALLYLMCTGETESLRHVLEASARQRIEEGVRYADKLAVWLLYRHAIQQALGTSLVSPVEWEQIIDRVDSALDWVMRVIYAVYDAANQV